MDELLVSVKPKHDSLDELQNSNNILVTINGFIFAITSHIVEKTLNALYVKNFKRPFQVLFKNFPSFN